MDSDGKTDENTKNVLLGIIDPRSFKIKSNANYSKLFTYCVLCLYVVPRGLVHNILMNFGT